MLRHFSQPHAMTYISLEVFLTVLQNSQKCSFNEKEALAQVVSREFCEIGLTSK